MSRVPDRSACPKEVRSYIVQTLTSKHKTDQHFAEEAARLWRVGRGSELHDTTLKYFQEIFGVDVGLCLFQSVREDRDEVWERSYTGIIHSWMIYGSSAYVFWSLIVSNLGGFTSLALPQLILGASQVSYAYQKPTGKDWMVAMGVGNICIAIFTLLWSRVR
ncbi:hypothetical protein BDV23DRAFT_180424 [Aspergillus alliaceus]|uniref:Uncharacterized protein n=1 Tax=Petromyces alliaceus TaxID=209559 RepID=A0A5N7CHK4_PETAA|nr:hypothetical protein BDV23DRAFT_180424 [Aspergillus alliaceus]